ncbi:DEAD/DEAH box helicase [Clostridium tyrobutyricum]|uniref:DEAD/DEAH box helicase n=1 Tax=Clostridium tyrobutyricum TaxID=1519 RepID=UPI001C38E107|nr:DEAD/DEAH box helicase family protein [Clostridium tyrobutyricum]
MPFKYNPNYFFTVKPHIYDNENLREPQIRGYYSIYEHFEINKKVSHAIMVLPTGVGKTGLMALLPYNISCGRVLIIAPQIVVKDTVIDALNPELPDNFWLKRKVFEKVSDLPAVIEFEGNKTKLEVLEAANIVVMNIQKLQKRLDSSPLKFLPNDFFDMIIIDEAHHSVAKTWVETIQHFSNAKVIKVTATPFRTDKKEIAGDLAYRYKLSQAMANGYVKSLENFLYVPDQLYLNIDRDTSKKYTVEQIQELGLKDEEWITRSVAYSIECSKKVVNKSIELLEEKVSKNNTVPHKIIAVACSIYHAKQIKELYESEGYATTIIHSDMDDIEKSNALNDIKNHRTKVVVNVSMLGEGYDHPYLSIAAIFRPFRNVLPYAQFIGRILRVIPENEINRPSDNIGQIVSHKFLELDNLWKYYKKEMQESEIIKHLREFDELEDIESTDNKKINDTNSDDSYGLAGESGNGKLIGDTYMTTELIKRKKEEDKKQEAQIIQLQKILNVNRENAIKILEQTEGQNSDIKRPDKYFATKRKNIDLDIKEKIVPCIITDLNIEQKANNLKNCRLFTNRYRWIPKRIKDNGGMLAVYFSSYLNNEIGYKRDSWTIDDYNIAYDKLPQCIEYVKNVLADYLNL